MKNNIVQLAEYPLPETREIEARLIATIINDSSAMVSAIRDVKPDMFSVKENRDLWNIITEMYNKGERVDLYTVMQKAERNYYIKEIVPINVEYGAFALEGLLSSFVDTYIKRMAYFTAMEALRRVSTGGSCPDIVELFGGFSENMEKGLKDTATRTTSDIANDLADMISSGKTNRIPTSINSVDFLTYGGFNGGNLIILAARPSVGKTTIALQMALGASLKEKKTLVYSLEMTSEELVQRLILSTGYITPAQLYSRTFEWSNYERAVAEVTNSNLSINDKTTGIDELCQKIRIEAQSGKCDFCVVDYLGLIPITNTKLNTAVALGEFTRKLKNTAKDCNIPILLLCQLNRQSANESRSPQLHDLRDSGAIEQDADIVIMLERAKEEGGIIDNAIDLWVRKNRNGRCNFDNPIRLVGNETYSNFVEK